jgi:hypothetical protein
LIKEDEDNFLCLGRNKELSFADRVQKDEVDINEKNILLIYIVTQDALYNDEACTITYFKDITFGILYEQMTAKIKMQSRISKNLQEKVAGPIQ